MVNAVLFKGLRIDRALEAAAAAALWSMWNNHPMQREASNGSSVQLILCLHSRLSRGGKGRCDKRAECVCLCVGERMEKSWPATAVGNLAASLKLPHSHFLKLSTGKWAWISASLVCAFHLVLINARLKCQWQLFTLNCKFLKKEVLTL